MTYIGTLGLIIAPPLPSKGYEREGENIMASRRPATARVLMPVMIELLQLLKLFSQSRSCAPFAVVAADVRESSKALLLYSRSMST